MKPQHDHGQYVARIRSMIYIMIISYISLVTHNVVPFVGMYLH